MTGGAGCDRDAGAAAFTVCSPSAALVFLLACLPYVETPWFEFVDYDDPDHVCGHPIVGLGLTVRGLFWAFGFGADPATDGWINWPLTWLSHMVDSALFGSWAGGHHLVNVFLHACNAVLVLALGRRLGLGPPGALLVAAVFAVHPAQVESVAWVSERKTVLCAGLMLLAILTYLQHRDIVAADGRVTTTGRAIASLVGWNVLGGLALLAKPLAVTLPCVLLLIDGLTLGQGRVASATEWLSSLVRRVPEKLPLIVAAAAICVWTIASQADAGAVHYLPLPTRLAHAVVAYSTYLRVFLAPVGFGCFHPHPGLPTAAVFTAAAATLVSVTTVVTGAMVRGRLLPLFGWLWFLGTLVPTIGVIQVGGNGWSDRYLYLPIVGLTMIVSDLTDWGMAAVGRRIPGLAGPAGRTAAVLAGTVWVTSLAVLALVQAATWRDTEALAVASVAASPTSAEAWNMLAVHQARRREVEAAEKSFGQAITLAASPLRRADHLANLGRMLLDVGRDADAAKAFAAVVEGVPRHAAGRRGLGVALTRLDATEEAVLIFRGLVAENPRDADAWVGLGNAQYRLGRFGEAVASYGRALAVDPRDPATLINRAWARLDSGDRAGAESDAIAASRLGDPQAADVLATLRSATPVPSFAVPTEGGPGSVP